MERIYNCPVCGSPHVTSKQINVFKCNSCDTVFKVKDSHNNLTTSEIYKKSIGSILEISAIVDGEEQFGTGIVVSPNGYILTCSHIISAEKENKTIVKNFCDAIIAKDKTNERIIKTEVVFSDENLDLALLYSEDAKKLPPIWISRTFPRVISCRSRDTLRGRDFPLTAMSATGTEKNNWLPT